ncbi:MAG TPA: cytochrome c peroxidase [Myxococcota bacterium]|nr:cytochrome c peroxidase [Myxococcota bacterium]HRY92782.1 cytochrome c peroxidase [Myxococcota bacterium]HSA20423.1 cytochrome c peroxidase [Myxococcota bacterium]
MRPRAPWISVLISLALASLAQAGAPPGARPSAGLSPEEALGKRIFFDEALSSPAGQSCATCHMPQAGFAGNGAADIAVYEGAVKGRFGDRNPPSSAYASFSPPFAKNAEGQYVGGQFWDGRAATLEEQAKGPFLNPAEQNLPDARALVDRVCQAAYGAQFKKLYGDAACSEPARGYDAVARAVAAYERSAESNRFSSKYDLARAGKVRLSEQEKRGVRLFDGKAKCARCHPSGPGPNNAPPVFTDFTYDNIGLPKNPKNPHYTTTPELNPEGAAHVDLGLGGALEDPAQHGKFKVPTLRNVAVSPPYGHNGCFRTLEDIVRFYNTRDLSGKWPAPEVKQNMNTAELGDLGLTEAEVADLVAFLKTLTDGYAAPK